MRLIERLVVVVGARSGYSRFLVSLLKAADSWRWLSGAENLINNKNLDVPGTAIRGEGGSAGIFSLERSVE